MPDRDPLKKHLTAWVSDDLTELVGRSETEYLEVKGPELDIRTSSGRASIARATAGMTSSVGGFVVVGADESDDTVTQIPGVDVTDTDVEALRRSLLDTIRPSGLFTGPRTFERENGRAAIVVQALRHPLGLPASSNGVFWTRTGSDTRRMDYEDVRRRLTSASDVTAPAQSRAERLAAETQGPLARWLAGVASDRGHSQSRPTPFGITCVPLNTPRDLGYTGGELYDALMRAAESERDSYQTHIGSGFDLTSNFEIRGTGVRASIDGDREFRLDHDGSASLAMNALMEGLDSHDLIDESAIETYAARYIALASHTLLSLVGPTPLFVRMISGSLWGIRVNRAQEVGHEFVAPAGGIDASSAIYRSVRVLATRARNATRGDDRARHNDDLGPYLEQMFVGPT